MKFTDSIGILLCFLGFHKTENKAEFFPECKRCGKHLHIGNPFRGDFDCWV